MLFITKEYLKPGMVLAMDIVLYNGNFNTFLLSKGQVLNETFIDKIIYHNIAGAYIENDAFDDIDIKSKISRKLEEKTLSAVKDSYKQFKISMGKISNTSVKQISTLAEELVNELFDGKELSFNIIEFKDYDDYTYQHCLNVATLGISTGISMGLSKSMLLELGMAGLLHDIGKMLIPLEIINKPDKLTDEEYKIMQMHPVYAVNKLIYMVSYPVLRGIESHHEKVDGTGYPYGKKSDNISLYAKILAVCDVYDALTSNRAYRKSCFPNEVIEYIMACVDTHFDYEVLTNFFTNIVAYPIGTFVKLSNNKLGVVVKNHSENIMRPVIRIVNGDNTVGEDIDLLYNKKFMSTTIIGMGYEESGNLDYNRISKTKIPPAQGEVNEK